LDTISTIVPQAGMLSELKELVTGTQAFVGAARVEAEIAGTQTGHRAPRL
jgi:hypothetical protein